MESKIQFNELIKSLIPRFPSKANQKPFIGQHSTPHEKITTVDLSSDETDTSGILAVGEKSSEFLSNIYRNGSQTHRTVVISDDEDEPKFNRAALTPKYIRKNDTESSSPVDNHCKSESSSVVPQVTPVNSLRQKHQHLSCLKDDAISSIVRKFEAKRLQDDKHILENEKA